MERGPSKHIPCRPADVVLAVRHPEREFMHGTWASHAPRRRPERDSVRADRSGGRAQEPTAARGIGGQDGSGARGAWLAMGNG